MSRAIITAPRRSEVSDAFPAPVRDPTLEGAAASQHQEKSDNYQDRLVKYIPAEVITLYLALTALIASQKDEFLSWAIFFVCVIATPVYLRFVQKVPSAMQLILSTCAFVVWVLAFGEPFTYIEGYKQVYGAVLLPIFTFFVACVKPPPSAQSPP